MLDLNLRVSRADIGIILRYGKSIKPLRNSNLSNHDIQLKNHFEINLNYEVYLTNLDSGIEVTHLSDIKATSTYFLWIRDQDGSFKIKKGEHKIYSDNNNSQSKTYLLTCKPAITKFFIGYEEEEKFDMREKEEDPLFMYCPFEGCKKPFRHSGNLKTHIRSHVIPYQLLKQCIDK